MSLAAGQALGRFEILARLGAGGMGEVYRARDGRLGREVAIKVLPAELASDASRLARFETEARAASALNHPNVVTIYDVGAEGPITYIAMELVEGSTLRDLLALGRLPLKKTLEVAAQIADGLARAHEAGIVHRDLKPENVAVSRDGVVKILDFGLAKLAFSSGSDTEAPTLEQATAPGTLLGTASYMSPEQARGLSVDFRSDQFSLGAVLFEMATQRRAFARATAVETMSAILTDEPPLDDVTPLPLRWTLERCLAKEPGDRYAATRDLAREIRGLAQHASELTKAPALPAGGARTRRRVPPLAVAAAAAILAAGLAYVAGRRSGIRAVAAPDFQQITFRRGSIRTARFTPDGASAIYAAAWDGEPMRIFVSRLGARESRALDVPPAVLASVSKDGELAFVLRPELPTTFRHVGTLARAGLEGGGVRELQPNVHDAEWTPDGKELAISRRTGGVDSIELPAGHVLYEGKTAVSDLRFSRDGRRIAFVEHFGPEGTCLDVIPSSGGAVRRLLCGFKPWTRGVAWSPADGEIWFSATTGRDLRVEAVSLGGARRVLLRAPGELTIYDVAPDGRALVTASQATVRITTGGVSRPERDLSFVEDEYILDMSRDGRVLLFYAWSVGELYTRTADGPPVRISTDLKQPATLSPDGRFVAATSPKPGEVAIVPIGAGETRVIATGLASIGGLAFTPDGASLLVGGRRGTEGPRIHLVPLAGGAPRPITEEGFGPAVLASPDGRFLTYDGSGRGFFGVVGSSEPPRLVPGLLANDNPTTWSADGRSLLVYRAGEVPCPLMRIDVATGTRTTVRTLLPSDPAGVWRIHPVCVTPDGGTWAYTSSRTMSDLYVVSGIARNGS